MGLFGAGSSTSNWANGTQQLIGARASTQAAKPVPAPRQVAQPSYQPPPQQAQQQQQSYEAYQAPEMDFGSGYGSGGGGSPMAGLNSPAPTQSGPGTGQFPMSAMDMGNNIFNVGSPSAANPMLGKRNPAIEGLTLALQKPRNY